jgi:hypothetical protein
MESKVFSGIESNRMQIESNEFFDFRYDSIRFDLDKNVIKKTLDCGGKKRKIQMMECQMTLIDISAILVDNPFENGSIYRWPIFFIIYDCQAGFVLNRIVF